MKIQDSGNVNDLKSDTSGHDPSLYMASARRVAATLRRAVTLFLSSDCSWLESPPTHPAPLL